MRIVFMGTPDFSATVLKRLHESYPVLAVVTGLDKPVGRGYKTAFSPLKAEAQRHSIPVLQFEKVSSEEGIAAIEALKPDIVVTAAFGQILSQRFLSVPKFGVLNVHASLLPKYRGSSPIQWAILNGESESGVTIMRTVKEVDAGDILLEKRVQIGQKETAGELFDRLAALGGEAIVEAVRLIEEGKAVFTPQDHSKATHCGMIKKSDGHIDFSKSCHALDCFVRGMTPWPSAFAYLDGKLLKVFEVERTSERPSGEHGEIVCADAKNGLVVCAGDGDLRLKSVQLEGFRRMNDCEFCMGRHIAPRTVLK